jgi:hypothetical protein
VSIATAEAPDAPVLVYNRRPQQIGFPKRKPITVVDGIKDMDPPERIKCQPGFSCAAYSDVHAAGMDDRRLNHYLDNGTITLVWWAPGAPPSDAYTTMTDLGIEDTKHAIAGTGDVRVLDALAERHDKPVIRAFAAARAASIRARNPTLVGKPLAQDDGGDVELGTF